MIRKKFLFYIFLSLLASTVSYAEDVQYKIVYVYDGDTVKLRPINSNHPNQDFKLRITDIDAPERNQAYGLQARRALIKLCQKKAVVVTAAILGEDQYKRALGKLECNHIDISKHLVSQGLAWQYKQYSQDAEIAFLETKARQQGLGVWSDDNATPPWDWRYKRAYH